MILIEQNIPLIDGVFPGIIKYFEPIPMDQVMRWDTASEPNFLPEEDFLQDTLSPTGIKGRGSY